MLVQDILQLTKAKNLDEEDRMIDVGRMVKSAVKKLAFMENFERLDVRLDLNVESKIKTKEMRLKLIVENLISNAVKYQDLEKEKSFIRITTSQKFDDFVFSLEDNGLGIPPDQQAKVFTMFKRFHPKTSFGSGLGLYMIKKSADILGADITFTDTEVGTKFELKIPIKQENKRAA